MVGLYYLSSLKLLYYDLKEVLEREFVDNAFEYQHIIIDEGQDFGAERIDESDILDLFCQYGEGLFGDEKTSFFIFYDKNQLVNSNKVPSYIVDVDSKLTLYQNCRNTKNIANTAYSLLNIHPIVSDRAWNGDEPQIICYHGKDDFYRKLNNLVKRISKDNASRVLISCASSLQYSVLSENIVNGKYKTIDSVKTNVYTSATFKGLEADDVIVVDLSNKTFDLENKTFYVAASRARKRLFVFLDKDVFDGLNLTDILKEHWDKSVNPRIDPFKLLAANMHCLPIKEDN